MSTTLMVTFKIRRGTAAEWTAANPVLALGEPGLETDTRKVKYGDGAAAWAALPYAAATVAWADVTGKPAFGTASLKNTGTSGDAVPVLNGAAVTWSAGATFGGVVAVSANLANQLSLTRTGSGQINVTMSFTLNGVTRFLGVIETGVLRFGNVSNLSGLTEAADVVTKGIGDARYALTGHTHTKADVGLGNVDNTSDVNKPISTAQQTALNAKEPTIAAGTAAQYWRGDKTWQALNKTAVGLANVDNTSDANKPVSTAQQTALNAKANLAGATFTGDVGIGTAPSNALHVHGVSGLAAIRLSDATNGLLGFPAGSASGLMSGAPANAMAIRAENGLEFSGGGNARHLRISTAGELIMGGAEIVMTATRHPVLRSYTVLTLPTVTPGGQLVYVSDGTLNKRLAISDGTNWRFPDGAIVS